MWQGYHGMENRLLSESIMCSEPVKRPPCGQSTERWFALNGCTKPLHNTWLLHMDSTVLWNINSYGSWRKVIYFWYLIAINLRVSQFALMSIWKLTEHIIIFSNKSLIFKDKIQVMSLSTLRTESNVHSYTSCRDHFMNAPSQWETILQCNIISHWLGTFTKWSLQVDENDCLLQVAVITESVFSGYSSDGGLP